MSLHSIGYLFREGLKSLWKNRTMTIASVGVLIDGCCRIALYEPFLYHDLH